MKFSEDDRIALGKLVAKPVFDRAKTEILNSSAKDPRGQVRPAENIAIDMAFEKGMEEAFRLLVVLTQPAPERHKAGAKPRSLRKTQKPE